MKPSHFLYKSDGLYYMQHIPEKPVANRSGFVMFNMFDYEYKLAEYKVALERSKEEAVLVTDPYVYQIAMHRYFPHFIDYSKTPQDNFAMCASIGQVYILNMEEEIEIYTKYINPCVPEKRCLKGKTPLSDREDWCKRKCELASTERFARIAEPKKAEESESQNSAIRALFNLFGGAWHHCTDEEEDKIIEAIKEKFEIKRRKTTT